MVERIYLTRETENNDWCKLATSKQKKTMELVHSYAYYSTTYLCFTG